ncbi:MAG: hypothetical protein SX243_06570 [Acidobacteriota bacterium]|nr:hypothetical protein [Acidobacteriota bacterium]
MDPALYTAIGALIVALLGGLFQLYQARISRVVELKAELAQEALRSYRQGLIEVCSSLLGFQDQLNLISKAEGARLSVKYREELHRARDEVMDSVRANHVTFPKEFRVLLLDARERCADIVLALELEGVWKGDHVKLEPGQVGRVRNVMVELGMIHQRLLAADISYSERVLRRIGGE